MLSCPELYLGLRFLMMVFVSSSSIGVNLNTVLSLLMFKYDLKSGFHTGSSSFASFGPIFMKKLFFRYFIFIRYLLFINIEMSWEFILDFGFAHYISNSSHVFLISFLDLLRKMPVELKDKVFKTIIRPAMTYGSGVGISKPDRKSKLTIDLR